MLSRVRRVSLEDLRNNYDAVVVHNFNGKARDPTITLELGKASALSAVARLLLCATGILQFRTGQLWRLLSWCLHVSVPACLSAFLIYYKVGHPNADISFSTALLCPEESYLDDYAAEAGFLQDWWKVSRRRSFEVGAFWLTMLALKALANFVGTGSVLSTMLDAPDLGVGAAFWIMSFYYALMCYTHLHICCGLELAVDGFGLRFFKEMDVEQALEEWSQVQVAPEILQVTPEWRTQPSQCQRVVDARQLTINQDASPMVAFAAEARHNQIIGELGAEHQEQLRAMYNSGLAEVNKLRNELGNANIALSIQRSEMGQGEVRFQQTESARELAVIEANRQAEAARRALEEANSNARRLREVETSARQNDAMRSHEVADMSSRMDELMRQLQAQRQQTEVLIQQNSALSSRVRDFEARDAALRIQEGIPQGPPPGIPVHPISTPKHGGDTPTEQATDAGRRTPPDGFSPGGGGGGGGPDGNGPSGGDDDHDRRSRKSKKDKKHKKKKSRRRKPQPDEDHKNDLVLSLEEAEGYARELRINGNSRRMKATENDDSVEDEVGRDYIIIGAWIFSGMTGITTSVDRHAQLTKYLIAFMKSRGLKDTFTSICINHGGNRRVHRDLLNHEDSLNHTLGVGSYQGGSVWVEQKDDFPIFRREGVAGGKSKCVKVTGGLEVNGRVYDTHDRMLSFHPKLWHQAQPWTGDRWTITAYTIRDVDGLSWEKSKSLMSLGFQLNSSRRLPFVPSLITGDSDEELTLYDFVKKKKKDEAEKDKEHFDEAGELKSAEDQPPPPPDYTEYFPDEGVIVRHHMQPRKAKYAVSAAEADVLNIGDLRLTERQLLGSTSAEELWDDGFRGGKASGLWTGTTYLFDRGIDKHHAVAAVKRIRDKNTAKKEARKQAFYDISQLSSGTGCMKQPVNIIEYDMKSFLEQAVQKYKDLAGPKYHTLKSASTPFADEKIARPIDDEAEAKSELDGSL
ncbi:unnamed protein product [Symbiodinium sp. CCMP2592]|nr:unnamed protein product [Symbiodinium sp. CCMP2592]